MPYLFFILIILLVFIVLMRNGMMARQKKMLDQLKAGWEKPKKMISILMKSRCIPSIINSLISIN